MKKLRSRTGDGGRGQGWCLDHYVIPVFIYNAHVLCPVQQPHIISLCEIKIPISWMRVVSGVDGSHQEVLLIIQTFKQSYSGTSPVVSCMVSPLLASASWRT